MFNTVIELAALSSTQLMVKRERNDQGKFMQVYDEPLAKNIRGARFPLSADQALSQLSDQSDFIRKAVINQLITEGLLEIPETDCEQK